MPGASWLVGGGATTVDDLLFVDSDICDGKARILRSERRFGGNIATALVAAARTGVGCAFLGHLPDDTVAPDLLAYLSEEGVDISRAQLSPATRPIRSTILVGPDGRRFIAFDDDTIVGLPDDLDLDLVRSARVLILDAYNPAAGIRAATAARVAGVAVVADLENAGTIRVGELADLADHLVVPRDLALSWTGMATPVEAVSALWRPDRSAVVVTGGADGCWYRASDEGPGSSVQHHPALRVNVIDTTGCGDVFHGVYAASLARGMGVADCVAAATVAAGECATHPGGIADPPHQHRSSVAASRTTPPGRTTTGHHLTQKAGPQ